MYQAQWTNNSQRNCGDDIAPSRPLQSSLIGNEIIMKKKSIEMFLVSKEKKKLKCFYHCINVEFMERYEP
jgi:hypothetical protein